MTLENYFKINFLMSYALIGNGIKATFPKRVQVGSEEKFIRSWGDFQKLNPSWIQRKTQGELSKEALKENLHINVPTNASNEVKNQATHIKQWIKEWVDSEETTIEDLRTLVKTITGSSTLHL